MDVIIKEVSSKTDLRKFIHLPETIHKSHENWLPNIYIDEWKFFDKRKNLSFHDCNTILLLAYKNAIPVGRIMGIIHKKYNELKNESTGRWAYLECYNDQQIAHDLLSEVEKWAKKNGMDKIIGPYGFSDKDPQGLLIEGFEHSPLIASACNFPYLIDLVENEGYQKEIDCIASLLNLSESLPPVYDKVLSRLQNNSDYKLLNFTKKSELKPFIKPLFSLMNKTYKNLYGYVPLTEKEMDAMASRYMPILDPRFVKIIESKQQIISFIIAIPHLTEGIQKSNGHLFPFGIFHIIKAAKKTKKLDLMLGAVDNDFQGLGIEVLMAIALLNSAKKAGYESLEIHLMLETNNAVLREMDRVNAKPHKRFRVFYKNL
jgi:GNAT superfamily N-acetyltransferase